MIEREPGAVYNPRKHKHVKVNAMSFGKLVRFMMDGVYSCQELAELTGLHIITVYQYTRELHKAGACRIVEWREDSRGRQMIKVYQIGLGRDMPRMRLTSAERQKASRQRKKANARQQTAVDRAKQAPHELPGAAKEQAARDVARGA